jgi:adenylate cyclase
LKVLVADDNYNNRQLIADILETMGHEALMAYNGQEALVVVEKEPPDLIILDVDMPGMNGFDVCKQLKGDPQTAKIPILMLTALTDVEYRVRGLGLGADDYLAKPFNPRELMERIKTRLRSKTETDGLRQTQETLRTTFEHFVPASVIDRLLRDGSRLKLGGQLQEVTVLFTDLENFTSIAEHTEPDQLITILNQYHTMVVEAIQQQEGTIDKFIGDSVMALFNTPVQQENHAERAVRTALEIAERLPAFHLQFEPVFRMAINIGIHTGMAVVGNIGAPAIMDFTALGDTVNLAARLQQMGGGGQILVSHDTFDRVEALVKAESLGSVVVKGRKNIVRPYQVMGLKG